VLPLLAGLADAASFDPDLRWRTLHAEHFDITFHQGEELLAEQMAVEAEHAWDTLTVEIGTSPRAKVQLVLVDWTDSANGYATIVPYNAIVIFVTAPSGDSTLGLYQDWNEAIITHELTHILHMDTVEGLPRLARLLMGHIISTHQLSPGWIVEGYATYQETKHTTGGRGRNAQVDMVKRASVLEGPFPPLGNLDGYQSLPPGGNLRYLFGQDFIQFIADTRGADKWSEWVHRYGRSVPFILPAKRTFGASFVQMYREWRAELTGRYQAQAARVQRDGATGFTILSEKGEICGRPSYSPDGQTLVYGCTDPRRGGTTWKAGPDGENRERLIKSKVASGISWRADSRSFLWSDAHVVELYNQFEDVFQYDFDKKQTGLVTNGARAKDPSLSPDGTRIVAVTNDAQRTRLSTITVDGRVLPLAEGGPHAVFDEPEWSPDGRLIAVSVWDRGMRDLWLYTADGTPWRRLTADTAIEGQPAWSADGKYLYFVGDRSGIANIYAVEVGTERLWRVTNVVIGAYGPAPRPDNKKLAFNVYSAEGTRVALMDLDPSAWRDMGLLPTLPDAFGALAAPPPPPPPTVDPRREPEPSRKAEQDEPYPFQHEVGPYNPLPTLFPPRFWQPGTYLTYTGETYGLYLAAATGGWDVLHQYGYSAWVTYRTDAAFLGGGGSVFVNRWRPVFGLSGATYVSPYSGSYAYSPAPNGGPAIPSIERATTYYWDHRTRGALSMSYPLTERSGVLAYYSAQLREPLDPLSADTYIPALPTRGFFSALGAGWSWGKGESYLLSISTEKGRYVAAGAEYTPSWLGSRMYDETNAIVSFNQLKLTGEWQEYHTNPWVPLHVVATKLSAGATAGDGFKYGSYRLGGSFSEGGLTVLPDEWRALRGFYPASDAGEWYWLGSAEYRLPIWRIERGWGTLPLWLQGVSGALFTDAGNAFDDTSEAGLSQSLVGVGAELRASFLFGYAWGMYGRLGYAFAALGDGIPLGSTDGLYLSLGSSF
jgi:hypothetical protein